MKYTTLAFALLLLTPLRAVAALDPPVRVKLSDGGFIKGERANPFTLARFTTGDHQTVAAPALESDWVDPGLAVWAGPYLGGYGLWSSEPYYYFGPRVGVGITLAPGFFFHRRR